MRLLTYQYQIQNLSKVEAFLVANLAGYQNIG